MENKRSELVQNFHYLKKAMVHCHRYTSKVFVSTKARSEQCGLRTATSRSTRQLQISNHEIQQLYMQLEVTYNNVVLLDCPPLSVVRTASLGGPAPHSLCG